MQIQNCREDQADRAENDSRPREPVASRLLGILAVQLLQCDDAQHDAGDAEDHQRAEFDQAENAQQQRNDRKGIALLHPPGVFLSPLLGLLIFSSEEWHAITRNRKRQFSSSAVDAWPGT